MITIYYVYKKNGKYYSDSKLFRDPQKALAFMYMFQDKFFNFEWSCDDPEDNDYLWRKWRPRINKDI